METLLHLFSSKYLFARSLGPWTSDLGWIFLVASIVLILLGFIIKRIGAKGDVFAKQSSTRFYHFGVSMGLLGVLLWAFRELNAFYISAPVILLVWLIFLIYWFARILYYRFITIPKRRKEIASQSRGSEYLP